MSTKRRERPAWYYFGPLWLVILPFVIAAWVWAGIFRVAKYVYEKQREKRDAEVSRR